MPSNTCFCAESECPICYASTPLDVVLRPCGHRFCSTCISKHLSIQFDSAKCPICRAPIALPEGIRVHESQKGFVLIIRMVKNRRVGLTLMNGINGSGVKVKKVSKDDLAVAAGIQRGDCIISINNIPCLSHAQGVMIIDAATVASIDLTFKIKTRRKTRLRWLQKLMFMTH